MYWGAGRWRTEVSSYSCWLPRARKETSALAAIDQTSPKVPASRVGGEIIRTSQLTKVYPGTDFAAVDRLDLTVHPGEIFGLLGPNGAGKTTTAGMLTTRVVPTSGEAHVGGIDVIAHPARAKQLIGVVSQQNTLDRSLTVWENLYFHGLLFGVPKRQAREVADELLEQFVLSKWAKASVHALSGGMAQRLMVARAILHRPAVLFMDEPTAGLDPQSRLALWEILGKLNRQGQTIMLTTHYMEEADQLCDRVAIMDHGKILALDTPADAQAEHRRGHDRDRADSGRRSCALRTARDEGRGSRPNPPRRRRSRALRAQPGPGTAATGSERGRGCRNSRERPLDLRADARDGVHSPYGQ